MSAVLHCRVIIARLEKVRRSIPLRRFAVRHGIFQGLFAKFQWFGVGDEMDTQICKTIVVFGKERPLRFGQRGCCNVRLKLPVPGDMICKAVGDKDMGVELGCKFHAEAFDNALGLIPARGIK